MQESNNNKDDRGLTLLHDIKLKMSSKTNDGKFESINYYVYPCLFLEIFKPVMHSKDWNSNNMYIKLTLKDHLFIKKYFDAFEKKVAKLGVEYPCNSYHLKDAENGIFIIRLNIPKKYQVFNENVSEQVLTKFPVPNYTFTKIKIKIKNLWVIFNPDRTISGTNIEIDTITL